MIRWFSRGALARSLVVLAAVAVGALGGRPAWADSTISLDPAAPVAPSVSACAEPDALPGRALWTFEVRDTALAEAGALTALAATFNTPTGEVEVEVHAKSAEPSPTSDPTSSAEPMATAQPTPTAELAEPVPGSGLDGRRAWVSTPVGWQLTAAAADITGTAGYLELVWFCSAVGSDSGAGPVPTLPAPTVVPTRQPALLGPALLGPTDKVHTSGAPTTLARTTTAPPTGRHAPAARAALPTTGTDVGGMLALGTSLFLAGLLLLIVRRQRMRAASRPEPGDDLRRAIVVTWRD